MPTIEVVSSSPRADAPVSGLVREALSRETGEGAAGASSVAILLPSARRAPGRATGEQAPEHEGSAPATTVVVGPPPSWVRAIQATPPVTTSLVVGAGWREGLPDLLVEVAIDAARAAAADGPAPAERGDEAAVRPDPVEVHVAWWVPSRRSLLVHATAAERADLLDLAVDGGSALRDGKEVDERIAEARRLAWFPRPVGPHHAAAVPASACLLVPVRHPTVRTVASHVAVRSSSAEVLQAAGNLARTRRVASRLRQRAARLRSNPTDAEVARADATDERWAIVVEVVDDRGELTRAWANGTDRHRVTAELAAGLAKDAARAGLAPGLFSPAQVGTARGRLDDLSTRTDMRWSTSRAPGRTSPIRPTRRR